MDLNLSDEQQQLVDAFGALYAKESSTERVRAAEPVGHDPELWLRLKENGALEMAVDEGAGGWGASLLDLALVAEQHGRYLGSAPLLEAQAAARLLARLGSQAGASVATRELLESAVGGDRLVTMALHAPRRGVLSLLPAGAVADDVVFFDRGSLWYAPLDGVAGDRAGVAGDRAGAGGDRAAAGGDRAAVANLGSLPLADVEVPAHVTELASGPEAARAFDEAVNEWMILMGNALIGMASRSIEIGVEYVKERKAFGVPIGSFQAVSHGLANAAVGRDGGTLLAREAAWSAAADAQPGRTLELGPLAFGFCADAAQEASYRSLHYHGGYGFMVEYDIGLYFRRARAWPGQYAEPDVAFSLAAQRRLASVSAAAADTNGAATTPATAPSTGSTAAPTTTGMDFWLGEKSETVRQEARAFLDEALTPEVRATMEETGVHHSWEFHRKLVERGWMAPGWPKEFGGQGRDPLEVLAFAEELQRAEAPTYGVGTTTMIAGVIRHVGTEEQKRLILPRALSGEIIIVLGFTEPEAGSDVAAAQTRAVRDGDQWIINGQKMFTTNAQEADYAFMLTRTNPDVPKHQGLTTFLVPLKQPGVEIRPVFTMSGERTNLTFYTDVRVHDSLRIGEVDGGWDTMAVGLTLERAGAHGGLSIQLLADMEHWATTTTDEDGRPRAEDPSVRARLGRAAAENEVITLLSRRTAWIQSVGGLPGVEGSMAKLYASEALTRQGADFMGMIGPDSLRSRGAATAVENGAAEYAVRFALGATTYGGTSEIQRNIIAQRGLGLPRAR